MDILLPVVNVGLFPNDDVTHVTIFPSQEPIVIGAIYNIGDMNPEEYFPSPPIKKKVDSEWVCGSLTSRELVLTSRTYPLLFTDSFGIHNVQDVSDINLRKLYQNSVPDPQNIFMGHPEVTSLRLSGIYNKFRQAPSDSIKLHKPKVLSLYLRNLYNKLKMEEETICVALPSDISLEVRPLLQKLRTQGLDETVTVNLPDAIEIHTKDVVTLYDNPDIIDFKIDTPEPLSIEVKGIYNNSTQGGDGFNLDLPSDIELGGSVKPVLTFPVLKGEIVSENLISLTWDDSSITHTGYTLYKSLEPIPVNTTQEPYRQLGRDVKQFEDSTDILPDTPIYYRVTPRTVYGNLFSNQVEIVDYTSRVITFMVQESPTYIPLRVDNNIIPLVPAVDTMWDGLNANFEQMEVLDVSLTSVYTPTPKYIEMRIYSE